MIFKLHVVKENGMSEYRIGDGNTATARFGKTFWPEGVQPPAELNITLPDGSDIQIRPKSERRGLSEEEKQARAAEKEAKKAAREAERQAAREARAKEREEAKAAREAERAAAREARAKEREAARAARNAEAETGSDGSEL